MGCDWGAWYVHDGACPSCGQPIAATMFPYFLDRNGALFDAGRELVDDSTLVAVTIMIAESKPEEKAVMVVLVMNFLAAFD